MLVLVPQSGILYQISHWYFRIGAKFSTTKSRHSKFCRFPNPPPPPLRYDPAICRAFCAAFCQNELGQVASSDGMEPRPITGTEGSRVNVLLGDDDEYVLTLNWDDGTTEWQEMDWNSPGPIARQLVNCSQKGRWVTHMALGSDPDWWYVRGVKEDGTGDHWWWGDACDEDFASAMSEDQKKIVVFGADGAWVTIDEDDDWYSHGSTTLHKELIKRMKKGKVEKLCLSLESSRAFWIKDDNGMYWCLGEHLEAEVDGTVLHVCEGKQGQWLVIRDTGFVASRGAPKDLQKKLASFYRQQSQYRKTRDKEIAQFRKAEERKRKAEEAALRKAEEAERARVAEEAARQERLAQEAMKRRGPLIEFISQLSRHSLTTEQEEAVEFSRLVSGAAEDMEHRARTVVLGSQGLGVTAHKSSDQGCPCKLHAPRSSPAAAAGLATGDILTSVTVPLQSPEHFRAVRGDQPGVLLTLFLLRKGVPVRATLLTGANGTVQGLRTSESTPLEVTHVEDGSTAAKAGVSGSDVLCAARVETTTLCHIQEATQVLPQGTPVAVTVCRQAKRLEICSICLEAITVPLQRHPLGCGHVFHRQCIREWTTKQRHCPNCRRAI